MKIIGKLEGGDRLVLLTAGELEACETLGRGAFQMAAHEVDQEKNLTQRRKDPKENLGSPGLGVKDNPKKRSRQGPKQAGPVRDKRCSVCGRKFRDTSRTNTRQVCSVKCAKQRERARNSRKQSPPPQRAPDINPADPSLTDAQRAELLRRREAMIRDSVERLGAGSRRKKDATDA
jgi:hypothetical protein